MPPVETLLSHDIAAGHIEFESIVFLRHDYLGPVPIDGQTMTLVPKAWDQLVERVTRPNVQKQPTGPKKRNPWVGPDEMARLLGITKTKLLTLKREGRVPSTDLGSKTIRFDPQEVVAALKSLDGGQPRKASNSGPPRPTHKTASTLPRASWSTVRVHPSQKHKPKE